MKIYNILAVLIAMLLCNTMQAQQTFTYTYDETGNRTKRELVTSTPTDSIGGGIWKPPTEDDLKPDTFSIRVYPNPSNGVYAVELLNLQPTQNGIIQVYSSAMVLVQEYRSLHAVQTIDITGYPPGYYALAVIIDNEVVKGEILIKQ